MKITLYILLSLLALINIGCQTPKLSAKIEFNKDSMMKGEEVYWNLIVKNLNSKPISIRGGSPWSNCNELNRDSDLIIELKDSNGTVINQIESKGHEIIVGNRRIGYKELLRNDKIIFTQ